MSLQFRDKEFMQGNVKCFAQVQVDDRWDFRRFDGASCSQTLSSNCYWNALVTSSATECTRGDQESGRCREDSSQDEETDS